MTQCPASSVEIPNREVACQRPGPHSGNHVAVIPAADDDGQLIDAYVSWPRATTWSSELVEDLASYAAVVRALADFSPYAQHEDCCLFCGAREGIYSDPDNLERHDVDCLWRLAHELPPRTMDGRRRRRRG